MSSDKEKNREEWISVIKAGVFSDLLWVGFILFFTAFLFGIITLDWRVVILFTSLGIIDFLIIYVLHSKKII